MKILVSACLMGCPCRYDGKGQAHPDVLALLDRHTLIPVCPEQLGGLSTPRPPAERQGDRVVTQTGADVTEQYRRGGEEASPPLRPNSARISSRVKSSPPLFDLSPRSLDMIPITCYFIGITSDAPPHTAEQPPPLRH